MKNKGKRAARRPNYVTRAEANNIRDEAAIKLCDELERLALVNVRSGMYERARGLTIAIDALDEQFFACPF